MSSSLSSPTQIHVEWEEPFTWPNFNISHYIVTEIIDEAISQILNTTGLYHTYSSPSGGVVEVCQNVTFQVTAVSDLGESQPGISVNGLPIGK